MAFSKALIVDDSKLARVTLKKKLESHGLEVLAVESASEAYQLLPQEQPDIVFMDHLMPDIDGFEATQHLRSQGVITPIIMCTGKEHEGYLEEALAIGASYILGKPPGDDDLEAVLSMEFVTDALTEVEELPIMTVEDFDLDELEQVLESVVQEQENEEDTDSQRVAEMENTVVAVEADITDWQVPANDLMPDVDDILIDDEEPPLAVMTHDEADDSGLPEADILCDQVDVPVLQSVDVIDEPVIAPPLVQGIDRQEAEMLIQSGIDAARSVILQEVGQQVQRLQQQLDESPIADSSDKQDNELLLTLEAILHPRLIELKASLLSDVQRKMQADKESGLDELLELRLNALLAERMAAMEQRVNDVEHAQVTIASSAAVADDGIPVVDDASKQRERFMMSEKVARHLDQLIEENAVFAVRIRQIRQLAIGAATAAAASLALTLFHFLLG